MNKGVMKITIKGNDVTPEKIAEALASCERDHELKIKGATIFLRLEDTIGRCCEPLSADGGHEISREFTFNKLRPIKMPQPMQQPQPRLEPVDPIPAREMFELCSKAAHRMLSSNEMKVLITLEKAQKPERQAFQNALNLSMQQNRSFSVQYLEQLILQQINCAQ